MPHLTLLPPEASVTLDITSTQQVFLVGGYDTDIVFVETCYKKVEEFSFIFWTEECFVKFPEQNSE